MGFLASSLSGSNGAGFKASPTNIINPTTTAQTDETAIQAQKGISQQQAFLDALKGQNGIANQNSVFNQQQALAVQLGQVASGQGPNPVQAQLAQNTGQNMAVQGALPAS